MKFCWTCTTFSFLTLTQSFAIDLQARQPRIVTPIATSINGASDITPSDPTARPSTSNSLSTTGSASTTSPLTSITSRSTSSAFSESNTSGPSSSAPSLSSSQDMTTSTNFTTSSTSFSSALSSSSSSSASLIESSTSSLETSASISSSSLSTPDITVTAVVPTSTGASVTSSRTPSKADFFANPGAVAGTFLIVGLFGTSIVLCFTFWARRKYRRHIERQNLYTDELWHFTRSLDRGITPEPTTQTMAEPSTSAPITPVPSVDMIENPHGNDTSLYPCPNSVAIPFQAEPGEFNPYHPHDAAYAFSTSEAHLHMPEQSNGTTYGYRRSSEGRITPEGQIIHPRVVYKHSNSSHSVT